MAYEIPFASSFKKFNGIYVGVSVHFSPYPEFTRFFKKDELTFRGMNKIAQAGQVVYIKDEFYTDNNLSVMEIPRYSWRVIKIDNGIAACEFQRKGRNSVMTLTIELKYLRVEMI